MRPFKKSEPFATPRKKEAVIPASDYNDWDIALTLPKMGVKGFRMFLNLFCVQIHKEKKLDLEKGRRVF
jgi:hypothetical protein